MMSFEAICPKAAAGVAENRKIIEFWILVVGIIGDLAKDCFKLANKLNHPKPFDT